VNSNEAFSRLGIGTVQFGLDYGIANKTGKPDQSVAENILNAARSFGVSYIDTSPAYGSSESILGKIIAGNSSSFKIVSKTPAFNSSAVNEQDREIVIASAEASLLQLGIKQLYGLLLHHGMNVTEIGGEHLISALQELKESGKVKKIGFSAYNVEEAEKILDVFTPDIIQIPVNIFDQSIINSALFKNLKSAGIEVHARSVFLQGLLLLNPNDLPAHFEGIKTQMLDFHAWLAKNSLSPLEGCIGFAFQTIGLDAIIIGSESAEQIRQILSAVEKVEKLDLDFSEWALNDPLITNPTLWLN